MTDELIYGLDFGASNSAISIVLEDKDLVLPVDSFSSQKNIIPTLLYYDDDRYFIGSRAHDLMRKNAGNKKGRFIRNIKSTLSLPGINGTYILKKYKTFSQIAADYMAHVKKQADSHLGLNVQNIAIGRPVYFSRDLENDEKAQQALHQAALSCGFEKIQFVYEPVAATFNEIEHFHPGDIILTFDFGGSTLDFHLLEIDKQKKIHTLNTHGLVLGGTNITKKIIEEKILKYFGHNVSYKSKFQDKKLNPGGMMLVPNSLPFVLLDNDINRSSDRAILKSIEKIQWDAMDEIAELELLKICLRNKTYYQLFDAVETAKIELSYHDNSIIKLDSENIQIEEPLTKKEFEKILMPYRKTIITGLDTLLAKSPVNKEQVNIVIRVGGSSEIPFFIHLLKEYFSQAKIQKSDIFGGVSRGLARIGRNHPEYVK